MNGSFKYTRKIIFSAKLKIYLINPGPTHPNLKERTTLKGEAQWGTFVSNQTNRKPIKTIS
jgi:hypothetical protein